jgi:hypothetical protein
MTWLDDMKSEIAAARGPWTSERLEHGVQDCTEELDKARAATEPGERLYLALQAEDKIDSLSRSLREYLGIQAIKHMFSASALGVAIVVLGAAASTIPLLTVLGAGIVISTASTYVWRLLERKESRRLQPHIDRIEALRPQAEDAAKGLLETKSLEIMASPRFPDLCRFDTELRDYFNMAAGQITAKHLLAAGVPSPKLPPPLFDSGH